METRTTLEHVTRIISGKEIPVTITRIYGLATYRDGDREVLADAATFIDYGPKLGVTRNYTLHKDVEPTEEERAEGRRNIQAVAAQALIDQGIW